MILTTQILFLGVLSVVLVVDIASDYILLSQRRLLSSHELPFWIHQMTRVVMARCFCSCPNPASIRSECFSAGLSDFPSVAVCPSSSQVLAFGQAAVRLERSQNREDERSLSKR